MKNGMACGNLSFTEAASQRNEGVEVPGRSSVLRGLKWSGRLTTMEETSTRASRTIASGPMTARHRLRSLWVIISQISIETVQIWSAAFTQTDG